VTGEAGHDGFMSVYILFTRLPEGHPANSREVLTNAPTGRRFKSRAAAI
jgi:hypothetical protein